MMKLTEEMVATILNTREWYTTKELSEKLTKKHSVNFSKQQIRNELWTLEIKGEIEVRNKDKPPLSARLIQRGTRCKATPCEFVPMLA